MMTSIQRACEAVLHWDEYAGRHGGDRKSSSVVVGVGLGSTKHILAQRFNTNHRYVQTMRRLFLTDPEEFERIRNGQRLVYAIGTGESPTKIGHTFSTTFRLPGLQTGSPSGLRVLATLDCDNSSELEDDIHQRLADRWIHGEWFDINDLEVQHLFAEYVSE